MSFRGKISTKNRLFKVIVCVLIQSLAIPYSLVFAVTDVPAPAGPSVMEVSASSLSEIYVPKKMGAMRDKFEGTSERVVIHIQDAHCNYEAQKNIAGMIQHLMDNYGVNFVAVEGADKHVDTSWFRSFPEAEIRREVADFFMKKGELTGTEFLSITGDKEFTIYGAEDKDTYVKNLRTFLDCYAHKQGFLDYFGDIKNALNSLKKHIYSRELRDLDRHISMYESKETELDEYASYLDKTAMENKVDLMPYENFTTLIKTLKYEKDIDFDTVNIERADLVDQLDTKLSRAEMTKLAEMSVDFKLDKIDSSVFHTYLGKLAEDNGIDIGVKYPNLKRYIIYSRIYSKINSEALFGEIDGIVVEIKESMFTDDTQRELDRMWTNINIVLGLVNIELTNDRYEYYKANSGEFSADVFIGFINRQATRFGLSYSMPAIPAELERLFPQLADFYQIAVKRDRILVENMFAGMEKERTKVAVLITGGFHTKGITDILKDEGVSYVVLTPTLKIQADSPYLAVLSGQSTFSSHALMTTIGKTGKDGLAPYLMARLLAMEQVDDMLKTRHPDEFKREWTAEYVRGWFSEVVPKLQEMGLDLTNRALVTDLVERSINLAIDNVNASGRNVSAEEREFILTAAREEIAALMSDDTRKAPGSDELNVADIVSIRSYINGQVAAGAYADVPVSDGVRDLIRDRAPPMAGDLLSALDDGSLVLRMVDSGPRIGFLRREGQQAEVFDFTYKDKGVTYVCVTRAFLFLNDPAHSYFLAELAKKSPEAAERAAAVEAQLLYHAFVSSRGVSRQEAYDNALALSTQPVSARGISDLDLFILDKASNENAYEYLKGLLAAGTGMPFSDAVIRAISRCMYINFSMDQIEELANDQNADIALAAQMARERLNATIDASLKAAAKKGGIFKGQDLRGTSLSMAPEADVEITYEVALRLGQSLAQSVMAASGKKRVKIGVGKDIRLSSPMVQRGLMDGIRKAGADVVDLGVPHMSTPMASFAAYHFGDMDATVEITASHNDWTYCGMKVILGKENMPSDILHELTARAGDATALTTARRKGGYEQRDLMTPYRESVKQQFTEWLGADPFKGLTIAVDAGGGVYGFFADIVEELGGKAIRVNCEPNGFYPEHIPNPVVDTGIRQLLDVVSANPGSIGVSFDSDGDRIAFVAEGGRAVSNHEILCLLAQGTDGPIVVNSRASLGVFDEMAAKNGTAKKARSGYVFIKEMAREIGAPVGGEESGHFMFAPDFIDDGIMTAGRIFGIAAEKKAAEGKTFAEAAAGTAFNRYLSSIDKAKVELKKQPGDNGQIANDQWKDINQEVIDRLIAYFGTPAMQDLGFWLDPAVQAGAWSDVNNIDGSIDGFMVYFGRQDNGLPQGWALYRPSLSQPDKVYIDIEAVDEQQVLQIGTELHKAFVQVTDGLEVDGVRPDMTAAADLINAANLGELISGAQAERGARVLSHDDNKKAKKSPGARDLTNGEARKIVDIIESHPQQRLHPYDHQDTMLDQILSVISVRGPPSGMDVYQQLEKALRDGEIQLVKVMEYDDELFPRDDREDLGVSTYARFEEEDGKKPLKVYVSGKLVDNTRELIAPAKLKYVLTQVLAHEYAEHLAQRQHSVAAQHELIFSSEDDASRRTISDINQYILNYAAAKTEEGREGLWYLMRVLNIYDPWKDKNSVFPAADGKYKVHLNGAMYGAIAAATGTDVQREIFCNKFFTGRRAVRNLRMWYKNAYIMALAQAETVPGKEEAWQQATATRKVGIAVREMERFIAPETFSQVFVTREVRPSDNIGEDPVFSPGNVGYFPENPIDINHPDWGGEEDYDPIPVACDKTSRVICGALRFPDGSIRTFVKQAPSPREAQAALGDMQVELAAAATVGGATILAPVIIDNLEKLEAEIDAIDAKGAAATPADAERIKFLRTVSTDIRDGVAVAELRDEVIHKLLFEKTDGERRVLVSVVGTGGAGKTSMADRLKRACTDAGFDAEVLSTDDYLYDRDFRYNYPGKARTNSRNRVLKGEEMYGWDVLKSQLRDLEKGRHVEAAKAHTVPVPGGEDAKVTSVAPLQMLMNARRDTTMESTYEAIRDAGHVVESVEGPRETKSVGKNVRVIILEGCYAGYPSIAGEMDIRTGFSDFSDRARIDRKITRDTDPNGDRKQNLDKLYGDLSDKWGWEFSEAVKYGIVGNPQTRPGAGVEGWQPADFIFRMDEEALYFRRLGPNTLIAKMERALVHLIETGDASRWAQILTTLGDRAISYQSTNQTDMAQLVRELTASRIKALQNIYPINSRGYLDAVLIRMPAAARREIARTYRDIVKEASRKKKVVRLLPVGPRGTRYAQSTTGRYGVEKPFTGTIYRDQRGNPKTFLQRATERALSGRNVPGEIYSVTDRSIEGDVVAALEPYGIPAGNVFGEPAGANTAAVMGIAAILVGEQFGYDTVISAMTTDHDIPEANLPQLADALDKIETAAALEPIIGILGIKPTGVDTSMGHVISNPRRLFGQPAVASVQSFVEKPVPSEAQRLTDEGATWNSGKFVFRADTVLRAFREFQPEYFQGLMRVRDALRRARMANPGKSLVELTREDPILKAILDEVYEQFGSAEWGGQQFEKAIVEKAAGETPHFATDVTVFDAPWSDLGNSYQRYVGEHADDKNNVVRAPAPQKVQLVDTRGSNIELNNADSQTRVRVYGMENTLVMYDDVSNKVFVTPMEHDFVLKYMYGAQMSDPELRKYVVVDERNPMGAERAAAEASPRDARGNLVVRGNGGDVMVLDSNKAGIPADKMAEQAPFCDSSNVTVYSEGGLTAVAGLKGVTVIRKGRDIYVYGPAYQDEASVMLGELVKDATTAKDRLESVRGRLSPGALQTGEAEALMAEAREEFWTNFRETGAFITADIEILAILANHPDREISEKATAEFMEVSRLVKDLHSKKSAEANNRIGAIGLNVTRLYDAALNDQLNEFGLNNMAAVLARLKKIQNPGQFNTARANKIKKVFVLTRSKPGGDVAVNSLIMQTMQDRFPGAEVILVGPKKHGQVFDNMGIRIAEPAKPAPVVINDVRRSPRLNELIMGNWTSLRGVIEPEMDDLQRGEESIVIDTFTRPVFFSTLPAFRGDADSGSYFYFDMVPYEDATGEKMTYGATVRQWARDIFGPANGEYYAKTSMPQEDKSKAARIFDELGMRDRHVVAIGNGCGGDYLKAMSQGFETELVKRVVAEDAQVVFDMGFTGEELQRAISIMGSLIAEGVSTGIVVTESGMEPGLVTIDAMRVRADEEARNVPRDQKTPLIPTQMTAANRPQVLFHYGPISGFGAMIGESQQYIGYDSSFQHTSSGLGQKITTVFTGYDSDDFPSMWSPYCANYKNIITVRTEDREARETEVLDRTLRSMRAYRDIDVMDSVLDSATPIARRLIAGDINMTEAVAEMMPNVTPDVAANMREYVNVVMQRDNAQVVYNATEQELANALRIMQLAALSQTPVITDLNLVRYAWAGAGNRAMYGLDAPVPGQNDVAESWHGSTVIKGGKEDNPTLITGTAIRVGGVSLGEVHLRELISAVPSVLGGQHLEKPFFVKFLSTRFSDKVHMGFNRNILDVGEDRFIEWLTEERSNAMELMDALREDLTLTEFENYLKDYEDWVRLQADRQWSLSSYDNAIYPGTDRSVATVISGMQQYFKTGTVLPELLGKISARRSEIVGVFNEIDLEPGQIILSPAGYPHAIFGLSHQTHPTEVLTNAAGEQEFPKNEAWVIISVTDQDGGEHLLLVEPQQMSNNTYSFADFYTPIVWDGKSGRPKMRKSVSNEDIAGFVRNGLYTDRATTPEDFFRQPTDITPAGAENATMEVLISGTAPVWAMDYFTVHRVTMAGQGEADRASVTMPNMEGTFHELLVTSGQATLKVEGQPDITLTPGMWIPIWANMGEYTLEAEGDAEILKFYPGKDSYADLEGTVADDSEEDPGGPSVGTPGPGQRAGQPETDVKKDPAQEMAHNLVDKGPLSIEQVDAVRAKKAEGKKMRLLIHKDLVPGNTLREHKKFFRTFMYPGSRSSDDYLLDFSTFTTAEELSGKLDHENYTNVVITSSGLDPAAYQALDPAQRGLIQQARMLTVQAPPIGDQANMFFAEILATAVRVGLMEQSDVEQQSELYREVMELMKLFTSRDVISAEEIGRMLPSDEDLVARVTNLITTLLMTMPVERLEVDETEIINRRQVMWSA